MSNRQADDERDFYEEGVDAWHAGKNDIPPDDVMEAGEKATGDWLDGWNGSAELAYADDHPEDY